jgi:hypothetical protein
MWYIDKNFEEFSVENDGKEQTPDVCEFKTVYVRSRGFNEAKKDTCIHPFLIFDDDGNLYYSGMCDTCDDEEAMGPLDNYGTPNAGATEIRYKNADGIFESL